MKGLENPVAKHAQKFSKGAGWHGGPKKHNRKQKHKEKLDERTSC